MAVGSVPLLLSTCSTAAAGAPRSKTPTSSSPSPSLSEAVAPPITSSQSPDAGPAFLGTAVTAQSLGAKTTFTPALSQMHIDAGNTGALDGPGPLGHNARIASVSTLTMSPFMWDSAGRLTVGRVGETGGHMTTYLAAVNPHTLGTEARWFPPANQSLSLAYAVMDAHDQVIVPTTERQIFIVRRSGSGAEASLREIRDIDLRGALSPAEEILATSPDSLGNIWFATGGIIGNGDHPPPYTTLGYVSPRGAVHTRHVSNQIVESGMAVSGRTVYVHTGPAGADDHANAVGDIFALTADESTGAIRTVWKDTYDAGSGVKPGGFSRGSRTPVLIGRRYLGITDNADNQIHLLVYDRGRPPSGGTGVNHDPRLVCDTPLFQPGSSANVVAPIGFSHGDTNSIVVANGYDAPPIIKSAAGFGSTANDMSSMAPGLERVDVRPGGHGCEVKWNAQVRIKSVPVLSTRTGLLYGYTQDASLAPGGDYVWYFVAVDYRSGRVVWQARTGAGGFFNDDYEAASLGPDGTLYQSLPLGVVWMRDGT